MKELRNFSFRPICLPDPIKDLKHESGPFTIAGFGYKNEFFSDYEELTGLKVPYVELQKEKDVKDLFMAEKVLYYNSHHHGIFIQIFSQESNLNI